MYHQRSLTALDKTAAEKYSQLDLGNNVIVTYVWVDDFGIGDEIRGKAKTLDFEPKTAEDVPKWTHARNPSAPTPEDPDLERVLKPIALFRDPFRGGKHKLAMCEITDYNDRPTRNSHRRRCAEVMEIVKDQEPWFGMEQEFIIFDLDGHPFGWPKHGYPKPKDAVLPYPPYCAVGANKVFARNLSDAHYHACLYAGIKIFGTNAESMQSQWEYQLGPVEGVAAGDQLWMSRYILHRVAEDFGIVVSMACKPIEGDNFNPNGCHMNFSTKAMREVGGIHEIYKAVEKLKDSHLAHLAYYAPNNGKDNEARLSGGGCAPELEKFSSEVGSRFATVRIPLGTANDGKGYLEDRRPAGNCDPYLVIAALGTTCCLRNGERRLSRVYQCPSKSE